MKKTGETLILPSTKCKHRMPACLAERKIAEIEKVIVLGIDLMPGFYTICRCIRTLFTNNLLSNSKKIIFD